MASRSGMFLTDKERKNLLANLQRHRANEASSSPTTVPKPNKVPPIATVLGPSFGTGCLACGEDDDHANLLLCEGCNAEYHTYCLSPPLRCVPAGDWFCGECKVPSFAPDDLDRLVNALPPAFTSRFGEVCWAHGGIGFGWWPSCIYDPRLTVGSARQLARKHMGKRHLVYFFECHEAPFTSLPDAKIVKWEVGLREDYHVGKTAKSAGKARYLLFQQALQAATIEAAKPIELRMDFNHSDHPQVLPSPKMIRKKSGGSKRKRRTSSDPPGLDEAVAAVTPQNLNASLENIANVPVEVPEPSAAAQQPNKRPAPDSLPAAASVTAPKVIKLPTKPTRSSVTTRSQPSQPQSATATSVSDTTTTVTTTAESQPTPPTEPMKVQPPATKKTTKKSQSRSTSPPRAAAAKASKLPVPSQPATTVTTNQDAQPVSSVVPQSVTVVAPTLATAVATTTTTADVTTAAPIPVATGNTGATDDADRNEPAGTNASNVPVVSTICCKILKQTPASTANVGFVQLTDRSSTFADTRRVMEEESVPDTIPSRRWKFLIPGLGPVSRKQEKTLGPMLQFMQGTSTDPIGQGTWLDPVCVTIVESVATPTK